MKVTKQIDIDFEVGPIQAAEAFCDFSSGDMAKFFNHVADISAGWKDGSGSFAMQMEYVCGEDELKPEGRTIMETIGEHAKPFIHPDDRTSDMDVPDDVVPPDDDIFNW